MDGGLAVLVILHGEKVVVAGFVVDPIIGRDHDVGVERGDDVVDDIFLGEAEFAGVNAIDVQAQAGIVHILRDVDLADAGQLADLRGQILRDAIGQIQIAGC